jgi:hypothetical protein
MPTLDDLSTLDANVGVQANDLIAIADSSASGRGGSKVRKVPAALVGLGFTHAWVINYTNAELAAQTTDDTDEEIKLIDIPANSVVTKAMFVVTEAFAGLTACNAFLGRTADTNGYIESTSLLAKTAKVNIAGDEVDAFGEVDVVTGSSQDLLLTFDPAGNTEALGTDLTAGQLVVLVAMPDIDDFKDIVPAT